MHGKGVMQYLIFTPDGGKDEEIWQPPIPEDASTSNIEESINEYSIPLTRFMIFNGEDTVYNELGMPSGSKLKQILGSDKTRQIYEENSRTIPYIQQIEKGAIIEQYARFESEIELGIPIEHVSLKRENYELIEQAMIQQCTKHSGFLIWIKRGKNPEFLNHRPIVLPNPAYWKSIVEPASSINSEQSQNAIDENDDEVLKINENDETVDDGLDSHNNNGKITINQSKDIICIASKKKRSAEYSKALLKLTAFNRGASEMAATAECILKYPKSSIQRHPDPNISIYDATNDFENAVLTQTEVNWYHSISSVDKITQSTQATVDAISSKPWELLDLPKVTDAQLRRIAEARALKEKRMSDAERDLVKTLTRKGTGN